MIILYFHLQPQFKYELFHILHIKEFNILHFFCFEGAARGVNDVSNSQLKFVDIPGIRLPFNYNL